MTALILFSCTKKEQIIIPDNNAPPDYTISDVTIENYVNKVYIAVLGREADSAEAKQGMDILRKNNLTSENRMEFLDTVFNKEVYPYRVCDIVRADLLDGMDTTEINYYIFIFNKALGDTVFMELWPEIELSKEKLEDLKNSPYDLAAKAIDVVEVHKRHVDNYIYNEFNMGTRNFVVSIFQHFLNRYPTESELDASSNMVDGINAIVFLQSGSSKEDFINIFFNTDDYYEGQVNSLYQRYLFRSPTSSEMSDATLKYMSSGSYTDLQKDILSLDEYIGL